MRLKYLSFSFISLSFIFLFSCNRDNEPKPADTYLVSYETKSSLSATAIKTFFATYGAGDFDSLARYDIKIYKVTYNTTVQGKDIVASGVIAVPIQVTQDLPVIGAYRGTIFSQDEAPSNTAFVSGYEIFSSLGFVTIMPDMIGFGTSSQYIHPYYNYELTASCAVDMIKAGEEFMKKLDITSNGKLFLYGYSEGGYIATATQKAIESGMSTGLTLSAVASGAGSYDPNEVMQDIVDRGVFTSPSYLAFIVYSYKNYYQWTDPLTEFFRSPFSETIPGLLDGKHNQSQINASLNDTLDILFQPAYLESVKNGTEELLTNAFEENRVDNFAPHVPTRFYHSPDDQYIPIADTKNTVQRMKDLGGDVEFIQIAGDSHENGGVEMVKTAIPWLAGMAGL